MTFADSLVCEGILVRADRTDYGRPKRITAEIYEPPQCQKFDDMANQLLLDKIDNQCADPLGAAFLEI